MKRLDLNGSAYGEVFLHIDALPSHVEKAYNSLRGNTKIWKLRELCLADKKTITGLPNFSKDVEEAVEERLQQHGLHFGMTLDELYGYMDEAYKEKNLKVELPAVELPLKPASEKVPEEAIQSESNKAENGSSTDINKILVVASFIGALAAGLTFRIIDIVVDALIRLL